MIARTEGSVNRTANLADRPTLSSWTTIEVRLLVVSQLAASFMLLIGAGLLTRSLMQLYAVLRDQQTRDALKQFNDQVLERVKAEGSVKKALAPRATSAA